MVEVAEGEVAPAETAPTEETPKEDTAVEPPAEEDTYASAKERLLASNEAYRSAHDAEQVEHDEDVRTKASQALFGSLEPQIRAAEDASRRAQGNFHKQSLGWEALKTSIDKAREEGGVSDEQWTGFLRTVPEAWDALKSIGEEVQEVKRLEGQATGGLNAANLFITYGLQSIGKPDLIPKFQARLSAGHDATAIVQDFVKELLAIGDTKGHKRGLAEGQSGKVEGAKVEDRKGGGPDMVAKGGGGGRSDAAILNDPNTPVSTLMEIRERQRAAGES